MQAYISVMKFDVCHGASIDLDVDGANTQKDESHIRPDDSSINQSVEILETSPNSKDCIGTNCTSIHMHIDGSTPPSNGSFIPLDEPVMIQDATVNVPAQNDTRDVPGGSAIMERNGEHLNSPNLVN
ncbi:hypothetical protein QAD02_017709 [Eretmocerus hayati]|uniref:Uncharacterized protein n=1 Tax=Eretmocerus hayati TaxID=131215 RepID=A0ACC2PEN7_9HYME|nr:hypothetical protein QAD02_017709 [Eretmocerus hayati]